MGTCVSLHKEPQSAVDLCLSVKSENVPSPVTINGGDHSVAALAVKSPFDGSKEEAFFDSQPWLESDGEDNFLSINGDFSPSRGQVPMKRLSELFEESLRREYVGDHQSETTTPNRVLEKRTVQCCLPRCS